MAKPLYKFEQFVNENFLEIVKDYFQKFKEKREHAKEDKRLREEYPIAYPVWLKIHNGEKTVDYVKGAGYLDKLIGSVRKGDVVQSYMDKNKLGYWELLDYKNYNDPPDMTDWSKWHFLGYVGLKPISNCTFEEFSQLYSKDLI